MTSRARRAFDKSSEEIDRLLEIHRDLGGDQRGKRRRLEVLNKSAVVLVTAIWEAYCEDIAAEGLKHLVEHAPDWTVLPKDLKKGVARDVEGDVNELAVWQLADEGWRDFLAERLDELAAERARRLNTPKSAHIDDLFSRALGIQRVSDAWHWRNMKTTTARRKLDRYVELRGAIAHRGAAASSVKRSDVTQYYDHVKQLVSKTGGRVNAIMREATGVPLW